MNTGSKQIWTIGHSTHTLGEFTAMLHSFKIEMVADIRSYPGSRRFPQFDKEALDVSLHKENIGYIHIKKLGGRRKANVNSKNTVWEHVAFRGYADYMETDDFTDGIKELIDVAIKYRTAYMCSEALWWRCHRSMVSDYLKVHDWKVSHIMAIGKEKEHTYTAPATILNGELSYRSSLNFGE